MEKQAHFYDQVYQNGGNNKIYHKHYMDSPYLSVWKKALKIIKEIKNSRLIEIGCGTGQFANMLFDNGVYHYKGIDYSKEAIKMSKENNSSFSDRFFVDNAYHSPIFNEEYNLVILFEVLEHLDGDIHILNKIKKGSTILFSVPNFNSESHVRFFNGKKDIINRYKSIVIINAIYPFYISKRNILFLVKSIKL